MAVEQGQRTQLREDETKKKTSEKMFALLFSVKIVINKNQIVKLIWNKDKIKPNYYHRSLAMQDDAMQEPPHIE